MTTNTYIQEAITLLNKSGFTQIEDVKVKQILPGETAVIHPLYAGNMLVSYLIGERDNYRNLKQERLNEFTKLIEEAFNDNDLSELCFTLHIDYENLGADTHDGRIWELVDYGRRHGKLEEMVMNCRQERPRTQWPTFPVVSEPTMLEKDQLAIIVAINQKVLQSVADYLTIQQQDCNYLLITTSPDYSKIVWLPPDEDWGSAVHDFYKTMQIIPQGKTHHYFFATPLPFAFAIGSALGLVRDRDHLYHWQGTRYDHVMTSSKEWKQG